VMRRCRRPGIAVAIVLVLTTAAHAESSLDAIRARGVLRVGVKSDAPSFGSLDAFGRRVGIEIDLARLFARVLFDDDRRVEFVPVTTATRFEVLEAGRVDLVAATITVTEERRKLAEDVAELQSRALLVAVASIGEAVRAVKGGQADAFVYDDVALLGWVQHDPALRVIGRPIGPRPYAVAARKGDAGLIRWVNGWLAKMRRDGSYGELWRRYFAPFESRLVGG
jgi:ABC-type amino acid transport substrate-binding protein